MNEDLDINAEYEQMFGAPVHEKLFSDEEHEAILRIVASEKVPPKGSKLPFDGIKLISYEMYLQAKEIESLSAKKVTIFYLKRIVNGEIVCDAVGYYPRNYPRFIVLKESFFKDNGFIQSLLNTKSPLCSELVASYRLEGGYYYEKDNHVYGSASIAASIYLGERYSFKEWIDKHGYTLSNHFIKYTAEDILESEDKTFDALTGEVNSSKRLGTDEIAEVSPRKTAAYESNIEALQHIVIPGRKSKPDETVKVQHHDTIIAENKIVSSHLFYIKEDGVCDASGYYEPETGYFYICKDSIAAIAESEDYKGSPSSKKRAKFLEKACELDLWGYHVCKDTKCHNAKAAACYVTGRIAESTLWKDSNGKGLHDYYPQKFFYKDLAITSPKIEGQKDHLFFLKSESNSNTFYDANGYYNPATNKFTIKSGSVLSLKSSKMCAQTIMDFAREIFVNKFCVKQSGGYRLINDQECSTPSLAAVYVVGSNRSGWRNWMDGNGRDISEVYGIEGLD